MGFITSFDPSINFWELNNTFIYKEPFKSFYANDKSKKKAESSKIMWFIAFCYDLDPKNIFSNVPISEKHTVVGKDYMDDPNFYKNNIKELAPLIPEYINLNTTIEERHVRHWEEYIDKRSAFLTSQDLTKENFEAIDKMAVGTDKLVMSIKKARENLAIERNNKGAAKGDKELSLSDRGEI